MSYKSYRALIMLAVLLLAGILPLTSVASEEVNIYSARQENLIKPLLDRFTQETGISVNLVTGDADALLKRLELEGANSPADILITTDAGRLHRARTAGVTQAFGSTIMTETVPSRFRDPDGHWIGLTVRARPIMYVQGKVDPGTLSTYEALSEKQWKGRICIRSSGNIYNQSLVASLIAANGEAATEQWAKGFVKNFARPPRGGDRDQIKAAAAGQCDLAIANTYYLAGMLTSKDAAQRAAAEQMGVFWPNQADRGTHMNISGATITRAAKNKDNAIRLLEFLLNKESQAWYAATNGEYPVRADVPASELLRSWGDFKQDTLNLGRLGELNPEALRLMDRVGWK